MTIDAGGAPGGVETIRLDGYLDETTQRRLVDEVRREFAGGCHRIVLDLAGLSFMTSTGLAALVDLWTTAREAGGDLVVIHPPPSISVLLRVLKLNERILIADSHEAAQKHFALLSSLPEPLPADDGPGPEPLPGE